MSKPGAINVLKKSGQTEFFNRDKVRKSLLSSGARPAIADEIIRLMTPEIHPGISTKHIYRIARKHLRRLDRSSNMRFCLKEAIYALGPSGYPFEKYVARIFESMGYETSVGHFVKGHCVSHEVDVIATNSDEQLMMECKFHQNSKISSDVKTALYVHSRFRDIESRLRKSGQLTRKFQGALITNTRFTSEAIKYANCAGLRAIGWRYPKKEGLEILINRTRAFPITALSSARKNILKTLMDNDIVLASDIHALSLNDMEGISGLPANILNNLKKQAGAICT